MCLYTYQKHAKKADKDIYVFKRLCFSVDNKKEIYTPYQGFKICRNKIAKLHALDFEKTGLDCHIDFSSLKHKKFYHIKYGFHAYKTYTEARSHIAKNEIIVRCKIPAGSYYFENNIEICSNKIEINVTYCSKNVLYAFTAWSSFSEYFKYIDKYIDKIGYYEY